MGRHGCCARDDRLAYFDERFAMSEQRNDLPCYWIPLGDAATDLLIFLEQHDRRIAEIERRRLRERQLADRRKKVTNVGSTILA